MRRRKKHEEHVNHEAWAIPYADLMTLLLAFFVVMYAASVVNEGKFRLMSASFVQAFNGSNHVLAPIGTSALSTRVIAPLPVAAKTAAPLPPIDTSMPSSVIDEPAARWSGVGASGNLPPAESPALAHIEQQVRQALQPLIDKQWVTVRHGKDWLEIEIRTDILFPSGVAQLSTSADQVLQHLASILAPFPNPLRVEGFTDNVPISTSMYPSNWELSAARAASVARLFAQFGVAPGRMGIVGWGDVKPVADNATVDGRNRNRRVLVLVMAQPSPSKHPQSTIDQWDSPPGQATANNTDTVLPTQYVTASAERAQGSNGVASSSPARERRPAVAEGAPVVVHAVALHARTAATAPLRRLSNEVQTR